MKGIEGICPQCGFTRDNIEEGGFRCLGPDEDHATFRATLRGTVGVNSSQLISYVEEWVQSSPSVLVQGLWLDVDKSCSVEIASLQDPGCQFSEEPSGSSSSGGSDNTGVVVGGAVAFAIVVVIVIAAIIIVALVLKNRRAEWNISQGE